MTAHIYEEGSQQKGMVINMGKPRIIIADTDLNYITLLELKFVEELFDKVNLEMITDKEYFDSLFLTPQKADVMIVSDDFYRETLTIHNDIENIFLITENNTGQQTLHKNVIEIYKYSNVNIIYSQIAGASGLGAKASNNSAPKKSQIILFFSATGGVGKTLLSMSVAAALANQFRQVLYINAGHLQTFQQHFKQQGAIISIDTYAKLTAKSDNAYPVIKEYIRKEKFSYVPPFKASLVALGMSYKIYESLAISAKKTGEYDYIIVDTETALHESNMNLLNTADRVVFVMNQNESSVVAANMMVDNINGLNSDKHIFICNNFDKQKNNAIVTMNKGLKFSVDEYVNHVLEDTETGREVSYEEMAENESIKKIAMFLMT
jgi:cellulose biosynthesis protein BcsQ/galactitol-specific phosphotransferase system IIB component